MKPAFSIIVPTYNRAHLIGITLDSILSQAYENFEVICADDGSTDNSKEVIQAYIEKDTRVKYHYQMNKGRSEARNLGVLHSKNEWLCFLDSDDIYFNNHLSTFVKMMEQNPHQKAFASELLYNGKVRQYHHKKLYQDQCNLYFKDFITSNPISLNQFCVLKKILPEIPFVQDKLPIAEDWLFFREFSAANNTILKCNIPTNEALDHEGRTMSQASAETIAFNLLEMNKLFIARNNLTLEQIKNVKGKDNLLAANMLLSAGLKRKSRPLLIEAIKSPSSYFTKSFYVAILKFLLLRGKKSISAPKMK